MAAPAEVSEKRSNFRIRQFKEKRLFNIAANLTLNTMVSFIILRIARTARIACSDRHTYIQTHETTTVPLSAHARRGLIKEPQSTVHVLHRTQYKYMYFNEAGKQQRTYTHVRSYNDKPIYPLALLYLKFNIYAFPCKISNKSC